MTRGNRTLPRWTLKYPIESIVADDAALFDQIRDCKDLTIDRQERDQILVQVSEILPGNEHAQDQVALLNAKGVPVSLKPGQGGGQWTAKNSLTI